MAAAATEPPRAVAPRSLGSEGARRDRRGRRKHRVRERDPRSCERAAARCFARCSGDDVLLRGRSHPRSDRLHRSSLARGDGDVVARDGAGPRCKRTSSPCALHGRLSALRSSLCGAHPPACAPGEGPSVHQAALRRLHVGAARGARIAVRQRALAVARPGHRHVALREGHRQRRRLRLQGRARRPRARRRLLARAPRMAASPARSPRAELPRRASAPFRVRRGPRSPVVRAVRAPRCPLRRLPSRDRQGACVRETRRAGARRRHVRSRRLRGDDAR